MFLSRRGGGEHQHNILHYTVAELPSSSAKFIQPKDMVHNMLAELTCTWYRVHTPLSKETLQFHEWAAEYGCQEKDQSGSTLYK